MDVLNIKISIDESGVLHHNSSDEYFVYGGVIFLDKDTSESKGRIFTDIERKIKASKGICFSDELKAQALNLKQKKSIFRMIKNEAFACVIKKDDVRNKIMDDKRSLQRFKDYTIVRAIKNSLIKKVDRNFIGEVNIFVFVDQQNIASNGCYNLRESLFEELFAGKYNETYPGKYIPPFFHNSSSINHKMQVTYSDSRYNKYVRMADIVANYVFGCKRNNIEKVYDQIDIIDLP